MNKTKLSIIKNDRFNAEIKIKIYLNFLTINV